MCRSIKPLFNFDPPATAEEIHAASVQFVRKITGFHKPSQANGGAFNLAIGEINEVCSRLLRTLAAHAPAKNREEEAAKAKRRVAQRYRS